LKLQHSFIDLFILFSWILTCNLVRSASRDTAGTS